MIDAIVTIINDSLKTVTLVDARFKQPSLKGIAVLIPKDVTGNIPCICNNNGEGEYVGFDDIHSIRLYHKNNGSKTSFEVKDQSGPIDKYFTTKYDMSLMVMAKRTVVQMSAEQLDVLISTGILSPTKIKREDFKLKSCSVKPVATNYNTALILGQEYKGQNISFEPNMILFEIKYTIECTYNKDCIKTICC